MDTYGDKGQQVIVGFRADEANGKQKQKPREQHIKGVTRTNLQRKKNRKQEEGEKVTKGRGKFPTGDARTLRARPVERIWGQIWGADLDTEVKQKTPPGGRGLAD